MGCCSRSRKKVVEARPEQKWEYINLNDFKAKGCGTGFAYVYLWFMLIISIAVYGVDTFTAINLLVFDRWSSEIEPSVNPDITKWIFSICIIASFVNLAFEQFRALRVMKRGNIAECYLDNLAVRQESIRMGKGQGFKRFLVFAELTKSKKGAEYIALFTYFSFQSWIRVLLCSGPRQVINAITLVSVYNAELTSDEAGNLGEGFLEFFEKIGVLAADSYQQVIILCGMCFTLVVWAFSALFLIIAILFYVFFLWHWIPKADGGLSGYCERKVNNSLTKIVHEKVNKAFAKEERKRLKAELKEAKKAGIDNPILARQATLPTLPNVELKEDKLPEMPMLDRTDSAAPTLPAYTSRPSSPGSRYELGPMGRSRPMPPRTATMTSTNSYASNAPLMGNEADMGHGMPTSPPASVTSRGRANNYPPPLRPGTSNSQRSARGPMGHNQTFSASSDNMPPMPVTSPTSRTFDGFSQAGSGYGDYNSRSNTMASDMGSQPGRPGYGDFGARSESPAPYRPNYNDYAGGRASPAPSTFSDVAAAPAALRPGPRPGARPGPPGSGYQTNRSATGPAPNRGPGPQYPPPQRNMTAPMPPSQGDYFERPGTAQSFRSNPRGPPSRGPTPGQGGYGYNGFDGDVESQRGGRY